MASRAEFTVVAPPSSRVTRGRWGVVLCRLPGGIEARVECKDWPFAPLDLLPGLKLCAAALVPTDYRGESRWLATEPVFPADAALSGLVHRLARHRPQLRPSLVRLLRRGAGGELLAATRTDDTQRVGRLLAISTARADEVLTLCRRFSAPPESGDSPTAREPRRPPADLREALNASASPTVDGASPVVDPYRLCTTPRTPDPRHTPRATLEMSDKLARAQGLKPDDPRRAAAYAEQAILSHSRKSGSYWHAEADVVREASAMMQKSWTDGISCADEALRGALRDGARFPRDENLVTTVEMATRECSIATALVALARRGPPVPQARRLADAILNPARAPVEGSLRRPRMIMETAPADRALAAPSPRRWGSTTTTTTEASVHANAWQDGPNQALNDRAAAKLISLDPTQQQAVLNALSHPVSVLTGGAGHGKSSVLAAIELLLRAAGQHLTLCAPTGKAAKRLTQLTGRPACTIHSMMGRREAPALVAIDEMSMVSPALFMRFLNAKGPSGGALRMLVLCGDDAQLPSIEPGALLRDLVAADRLPTTVLTTVHRTGPGSDLAYRAREIAAGNPAGIAPCGAAIDNACAAWIIQHGTRDESIAAALRRARVLHAAQEPCVVLAQTRATCERLNAELQSTHNPPSDGKPELARSAASCTGARGAKRGEATRPPWRLGDRVIVVETAFDPGAPSNRLHTNGDLGVIVTIDGAARRFAVRFDDHGARSRAVFFGADTCDVLHAYAMTVHRFQGSESDHAVVVLDMTTHLQSREALYTAATRGAKTVALCADTRTLQAALRRSARATRCTRLQQRLVSAFAKRLREEG